MAEQKITIEKFKEAVRGSGGIKKMIADRLGVHRNTVENYLKRYATAREVYDEEVETLGDLVESKILTAIKNDDIDAAKWYARMKLKSRGYTERQEISGVDGGAVRLVIDWGDSGSQPES